MKAGSLYNSTSYAFAASTGVLIPARYLPNGGLFSWLDSEDRAFKTNPRAGLPAKQAPFCHMNEDAIQNMFTESLKRDAKARFK